NVFARRKDYPYSVFFILGNEFCERFAYYGMRAILVLYLKNWLNFSDDNSTSIFHAFVMLCYFTPLFGAIIADGYIGKFNTIFYISMIYTAGSIVMAATAFPPPEKVGPLIGLLLIGLGTGGIKSCVGPLGADQFRPEQEKERSSFFSAFYFMINMGSLLSMLLTPILRADVHCIKDTCYPLAFGVPAVLMIIATVILRAGKSQYKLVPPTGNLIGRVFRCIILGLKGKIKHRGNSAEKKSHWLYYADSKFEVAFIEDVRILLKVLFMFLPLPLFWALFDQQGSRWTLQAEKMNGDLGIFGRLKPDQMPSLNALFIIVMIPLFEKLIYPCLDKCKIPNRPLQRMVAGMFLCAASFVIAAVLQIYIDMSSFQRISPGTHSFTFSGDCIKSDRISKSFSMKGGEAYRMVVAKNESQVNIHMVLDRRKSPESGMSEISVFMVQNSYSYISAITLIPKSYSGEITDYKGPVIPRDETNGRTFLQFKADLYKIYWRDGQNGSTWQFSNHKVDIGPRSSYTLFLSDLNTNKSIAELFSSTEEGQVSMLWQIPQYMVITMGEILYSITALAFSYSQAPKSMKSVIQAALLMTTAGGSAIVIIVAQVQFFETQVAEFLFFAGLMTVDTVIFMIMSAFYTYYYTSGQGNDGDDKTILVHSEEDSEDIPLRDQNVSQKYVKNDDSKID
ncbi:hypothetical protein FSP39_016931, partial [Pinctada imbricata]